MWKNKVSLSMGALSKGARLWIVLGLGLLVCLPASAADRNLQRMALAVSIFGGTPSDEPFQVVTGYAGSEYTATRGSAITTTDEAILLNRDGIYQIHLEGNLFFDGAEAVDAEAAGVWAVLLNDEVWVQCATPSFAGSTDLPAAAGFDRVAKCLVNLTIEVNKQGNDFALARNSRLQAALIPNDHSLGSNTVFIARIEVTRVGP